MTKDWNPDWDLGDPGTVDEDGFFIWKRSESDGSSTFVRRRPSDAVITDPNTSDPTSAFEGDNWKVDRDPMGRMILAQTEPGSELNAFALASDKVSLELIDSLDRTEYDVGIAKDWQGADYYLTYGNYDWEYANAMWASTGYSLVSVNSQAEWENEILPLLPSNENVWIGAYNVNSSSPSNWSLNWVDGTTASDSSGFSNFASGEPNDAGFWSWWPWIHEDLVEVYPSGKWNDIHLLNRDLSRRKLRAILERPAHWGTEYKVNEVQTDYHYRMVTDWNEIKDVRTDITYLAFTEAHDIVDKRPHYETRETLVPVNSSPTGNTNLATRRAQFR